tara:strand:- start:4944 stop:5369 length:426 start_codon:yes stop_codon:yes gene_type:complete
MFQAFDKIRDAAASQGKDLAKVQGDDFLNEAKKQGRIIAPTAQELTDKAVKLKFRLKRKPGVSPAKELARRIRAKGTFARGWFISKVTSEKFKIRIWITNKSAESEKVDNQKKVSDKAEKASGGRFKGRLEKLANSVTSRF